MAMENPEDLESMRIMDTSMTPCSDESGQVNGTVKESVNPGVDLLDDLDSYMEDINERLTISRMVSDSVIKGMVGAMEQEAAAKITQKESEIIRLKERLLCYELFATDNGDLECPSMHMNMGGSAQSWSNLVLSSVNVGESINFLKKRKEEFSSLRQELDGLNKLLSTSDAGHLTSHGSEEAGEECGNGGNGKVSDHLHRKLSGSHVFTSSTLWEANDKHEELTIAMPENIDTAKLGHLSKENLVDYFKTEMIRMKRNHESKVQEMTEVYFRLKREYLRERGSTVPMKKDMDLDELKRKIPEVISKLDKILVDNDIVPSLSSNIKCLGSMKQRLDALHSENSRLKDMLADKNREIERLSAEVSDAGKKIPCYSLAETDLLEAIEILKQEKEEERIKSTVFEEVYQCFLKMLPTDICYTSANPCLESDRAKVICELSCGEADSCTSDSSQSEIEDLWMESVISQELSGLVFVQALKEAKEQFDSLSDECVHEKVLRVSVEQELLEEAELLKSEALENRRLKEEMLHLAASKEEKGRLAEERGNLLARAKELLYQATHELERLRDETSRQGNLIAEISKESEAIRSDLDQALGKIEMYKEESCKLNQKLDFAMQELNQKEEEKKLLLGTMQEKHSKLLLAEVNERECMKHMESVIGVARGIMKSLAELENRAAVDIKRNQSRLEMMGSDLESVTRAASLIKRLGLTYKEKFERKSVDLEKAENEVDLLGDEVDNLLSLLEKIYIALDHYSPILKHYPGVMEILKLVKGELSGKSAKSV